MKILSRAILAAALLCSLSPVFGQSAPPPVPALPDTERRTSYTISGSTCACAINMAIYGDSTDFQNWIEVFINGAPATYNDPNLGWVITSPTGPLSTIPRPITDAVLTFTNAQTGTIQIVGARRPRRVAQFSENRGVAARDLNQALTDIIAQNRETWDKINDVTGRVPLARPGETLALLPVLASRANMGACFDNNGNLTSCVSGVPNGTITAGSGILFTGTNPTTISNNITAGAGVAITGTNPLTIKAGAGVDRNCLNAKSANYSIATADEGCTVYVTGGPFTITLPTVSGFSSNATINVCNGNANDITQHAVLLSGFPVSLSPRLYMQQCATVAIENGSWVVKQNPGRFRPTFIPTIYVNPNGADTNDGLVSNATSNTVTSLDQCVYILQNEFDLISRGASVPTCKMAPSVYTMPTFVFARNGTGIGVINVLGDGGIATLRTSGGIVIEEVDFAGYLILGNIQLDCSFGTHPCIGLYLHQQTGVDLASAAPANNPVFLNGGSILDIGVYCDSFCKINAGGGQAVNFTGSFLNGFKLELGSIASINNGANIAASFNSNFIQMSGGSQLLWSGQAAFGTNSASQFLYASGAGTNAIFATYTQTGAIGGGAKAYTVINNSLLCNQSSVALPGSAGSNTASGAANGVVANSGVSGLCTP